MAEHLVQPTRCCDIRRHLSFPHRRIRGVDSSGRSGSHGKSCGFNYPGSHQPPTMAASPSASNCSVCVADGDRPLEKEGLARSRPWQVMQIRPARLVPSECNRGKYSKPLATLFRRKMRLQLRSRCRSRKNASFSNCGRARMAADGGRIQNRCRK